MVIFTTRFGQVEVTEEDILVFPEGLLGFAQLAKFVLLDDPNEEIFAWLQSCEAPDIAFPVLEPELFSHQYQLSLTKHDLEVLHARDVSEVRAFSIITVPEDPTLMTANLKAPVIVNVARRLGRQCVLQDSQLAIREPIFTILQQRVVQYPQNSLKARIDKLGVVISAPRSMHEPELSE